MAKLVTNSEWSEFRDAINDVIDTFHELTIQYHSADSSTGFDRSGETNKSTITDYTLRCFVEYEQGSSDTETSRKLRGSKDMQQLTVAFGVDYLEGLQLYSTTLKEATFNRSTDYFTYQGQKYKLIGMYMDGTIKDKPALVICQLLKEEKNG